MSQIKTFTTPIKIFHAKEELEALDVEVNRFLEEHSPPLRVLSVSDTCTTDDQGATIGIIRVLAYE